MREDRVFDDGEPSAGPAPAIIGDRVPTRRTGTVEDVAPAVFFSLARAADFPTGELLAVSWRL